MSLDTDTIHGVDDHDNWALERPEAEHLLDRLENPRTAAALNTLLDNAELIAVLVAGLDGLARRGEVIGDTLAEVLGEVRGAVSASGLDPGRTARQLSTIIPTLADASPAINRILDSPIVEPEPIDILSDTAVALVRGLKAAQANDARLSFTGVLRATRDPDVQRGLGFAMEVIREFGRSLGDHTTPTADRSDADTATDRKES